MTNNIAWAAGLLEGEGYIYPNRIYRSVRLGMTQTDLDVLTKLRDTFGGKISPRKKQQPHHKDAWEWRLGKASLVKLALVSMFPLLGERRAYQAANAIDYLDNC